MKLIVMIPNKTGEFLRPAIAIVTKFDPHPGDYVSMCRTEAGGQHDYCVDDFNVYIWDLERIASDILYSVFDQLRL